MTDISSWSRLASDNKQASPGGAQEGWTGADIGPWARETMGAVARFYQDALWVSKIDDIAPANTPKSVAKADATNLTIGNFTSDPSTYFPAGRMMRIVTDVSVTPAFVSATSYLSGTLTLTLDCLANSVSGVAELPTGTYSSAGVQFFALSEDGNDDVTKHYATYTGHQTVGPSVLSGGGSETVRDAKFPVVPPVDGVLWYNTTTNSLQATSGGSWMETGDGLYNVKNYGATGDGTTDDRAAIQSAIDAADAAGGGEVFFPPGTYSIETTDANVTVDLKANVSLVGTGITSILKRDDDAKTDSNLLTITNVGNIRISHLYFDGNSAQQASTTGAEIMFVSTSAIENISISECSFNDFKGNGIRVNGSAQQNASGIRITGCRFISTAALGHFVYANHKATHIEIVGNYFDGTSSDATANSIWVGNESNDALISGNYIYNSGDMGIEYWQNSGGGGVISNNRVINSGTFGISVHESPRTSVADNHIDLNSVGTNGIEIVSGATGKSDYCTITGNVVENAAANGIIINKASYCTVSANVFKNCGDTAPDTSIRIFADDSAGAGDETASYNQISNNVIHMGSGGIYGISLFCNHAAEDGSSSIDGCQISDNILIGQSHASSYGVHITRNVTGTGSVEGNSVYNNRIENVAAGIYKNANTGDTQISGNSFSSVTTHYSDDVTNTSDLGNSFTELTVASDASGLPTSLLGELFEIAHGRTTAPVLVSAFLRITSGTRGTHIWGTGDEIWGFAASRMEGATEHGWNIVTNDTNIRWQGAANETFIFDQAGSRMTLSSMRGTFDFVMRLWW